MSKKYTLCRRGEVINLSGRPLFKKVDDKFGCEVAVHHHPQFGYILFIDGEAQISSRDYYAYHEAMKSLIPGYMDPDCDDYQRPRILVIGDGDGGFANEPALNVDQVEMSSVVRAAATAAFDVEWPEPYKGGNAPTWRQGQAQHRLFDMTLHDFLSCGASYPRGGYDAVILAITDDFNKNLDNFGDVLKLWHDYVRPGGALIAQVGCLDDPDFPYYHGNYMALKRSILNELSHSVESSPYIPVFHSQHLFIAHYKKEEKCIAS